MNEKLSQFGDTTGFVKSNLESIYSTRSWEEMDQTRDQALRDYMAGVTDNLTPATTTPQSMPERTNDDNPYDTQAEVLSRLNLLDESLTPTQTYTDYINAGGTPVPGFESSHDTLLKLDQIQEKQKEYEQGSITEEQMLWDLYAHDILNTQGYNTRSVGWWQSKYQNNDFSNPLTNQYLQQSVLQNAREYHNSLLAQQYAKNKQTVDSRLSTLLNKGDLANEDIEQLFPELTKAIKETQDDIDYQSYITSGRVSAQQRIYQAADGTYYYLHTDGELYKLSNTERGAKVASFSQNPDGSFKSISINQSDAIDLAQSFKAGAVSTVTSFVKLGGFLWGAATNSLEDTMKNLDSALNDDWSWATDSGYVDLDGFQAGDAKDWGMFISSTLGAMTAGAITGNVAGKAVGWGNTLTRAGHPVLGHALSWGASLYQRSTGLYFGAGSGFYNAGPITKHIATSWLPMFNTAKTVSVYMLKDYMNTSNQLYQQRIQQQLSDYQNNPDEYDKTKYATDQDIRSATMRVSLLNGLISMCMAGGMDDNQTVRWTALLGGAGKDVTNPQAMNALGRHLMKYSIAYNTVGDFLDNFLTNWTAGQVNLDKDGKVDGFNIFNSSDWNMFNAQGIRTLVQASIQTLPTFAKQLQRRNVAAEQASVLHKNYLDTLAKKEAETTDAHQKEVIQTVRANYLEDMMNGPTDSDGNPIANQSQADKILYALSRQHEYLRNSNDESIVSDVIKRTCDPVMVGIYTKMNELAEDSYRTFLQRAQDTPKEVQTKGIRAALGNMIRNQFTKHFTQKEAAETYAQNLALVNKFVNDSINTYLTITDSHDSTDIHERLLSRLNLTAEKLDEVQEGFLTVKQMLDQKEAFKATGTVRTTDKSLLENAAQAQADRLNQGLKEDDPNRISAQDVLNSSRFFRLKNETNDRKTFNAERAAFFVANLVLGDSFYKIDNDTYGIMAIDNEISKMFHTDALSKMCVAMNALPTYTDEAIDLMLSTMWGDTAYRGFKQGQYDKAIAKENVELILNAAIDNNVISKRDAASFLMKLSEADNDTGKELNKLFTNTVDAGTLSKFDNLSDLEKYTIIYASVLQINNPESNRFSGKTLSAEAILQQGYDDVLFEVSKDIPNLKPLIKNYVDKYKAAKEREYFPLATDSLVRGLTQVIGDDNIKTKSDLKKYIKGLAPTAENKEVDAIYTRLSDMMDELNKYKSVSYQGDKVTIDISEWSNEDYRKMINDINNTPEDFIEGKRQKGTLTEMSESSAKQFLKYRDKNNKQLISFTLDDSNMESINSLYDMLHDGNLIPSYVRRPQSAEDMKKILNDHISDSKFVKYKNSKEYDTGIINSKEKEILQRRLASYSPKDIIETVGVFEPKTRKELTYDYYTILGSNIKINKLSSDVQGVRYRTDDMPFFINPFDKDKVQKNGAAVYITADTNNENKLGRAGNTVKSIQAAKNVEAAIAEVNKDLAQTMMVDSYIEYVINNKNNLNIIIPEKFINKLTTLEIIGDKGFYELDSTPVDGYVRLSLKPNTTKESMELYLLSNKNPNLFKILPFVSDDKANFSIPFLTPAGEKADFVPNITGNNFTDYYGLYEILNLNFDYDQTGRLKEGIFKALFKQAQNGSFEFNPFSEYKQMLDIDKIKEITDIDDDLEAYTAYRTQYNVGEEVKDGILLKDINDPFYTLAVAYDEMNTKYIDDANNDNYKLWLLHGNVLKKMIQTAQAGEDINISEIKNLYKDSTNFNPAVGYYSPDYIPYKNITSASYWGSPINIAGDTAVSKQMIDNAIGADYRLIDDNGNYTVKSMNDDSIIQAFDYVKNHINDFNQTNDIVMNAWDGDVNNFRYYTPTGATSLWTILSAAEGSITIEDLDALTRIEADAYNNFFEQLGYKQGYGLQVKQKVDSLYDKLRGYLIGDESSTLVINAQKRFEQTRAAGAGTSAQANREIFNLKSPGFKDAMNARADAYLKHREDIPQITPQRLIDVMGDNAKEFESAYTQSHRTDLDEYKSKLYNRVGEIAVDDNGDYKGQTILDDISADINIDKLARASKNTHDTMVKEFNIKNKDIEDKMIDYTTNMVERMTGTRYLSEYAKYSFIDLNTGEEYANAVVSNENGTRSTVDLVRTLWDDTKTNKDWIGKAYIEFDKKDTSGEGLSYSYKILKDENDVINLKNETLVGLLKQNEWKLDGDVENFAKTMTSQEQVNFVNKLIQEGITNRDKVALLDSALKATNITNWQYKTIVQPYMTDLNKNSIRDYMGIESSALHSTSEGVRHLANAIIFGIDYDGMDDTHKAAVDTIKNYYSQEYEDFIDANKYELNDIEYKINTGKELTSQQSNKYKELYGVDVNDKSTISKAIYKYLIRNYKNPEVLDYMFNNRRSLMERYDSYTNGYGDTYKFNKLDGSLSEVSVDDIVKFFDNEDTNYSGNLHKIIAFDTEGSNKVKASGQTADSIKDLFQISFITYERGEDGKLHEKQETYFINHGTPFDKWVEDQINYSDSFYLNHKDYQEAIKTYRNLNGNEANVISEQEVFDILNGRLTSAPDMLIAYNGDNYEYRVLKDGLDSNINTLDALKSIMKVEGDTTISISQDSVYKRTFGDEHGDEHHTADQDTRDMMDLLKEYFVSDNDISSDRSLLIKNLMNLIPEEYNSADKLHSIFDEVESMLEVKDKGIYTGKNIEDLFKQFNDYLPTLDNIKQLQRSYNYLMNDAKGNVFFKVREALGYNQDNPFDRLVSDNTSKFNVINVLATKMLETDGDASKALDRLYYDYAEGLGDNQSFYDFMDKLTTLDEETLEKIHIDEARFNNEDVQTNRNKLITMFKQGEAGFKDGKIDFISPELAKKYMDERNFLPYVQSFENLIVDLDKGKLFTEDDLNVLKNLMSNKAIWVSEDYDINNLSDYKKNYIRYSTPQADRILKEIQNIIDDNRGTSTFNGIYTLMDSINPGFNEGVMEILPNGRKVQLDNVEAGDIVVSEAALQKLLNVYDIEDLKVDDSDDLYLLSVTNPADNMNSILPLRVRLIEGDENTIRFTPETQEILRNRDFDGDHTMTTVLPSGMKPLASLLHKYMFSTYNVYEDLAKYLRDNNTGDFSNKGLSNAHMLKIGSNPEVVKVSKELDNFLASVHDKVELSKTDLKKIDSYKNKLSKAIFNSDEYKTILNNMWILPDEVKAFNDDILKTLGVKEVFTNTPDVIRYVNNPALFGIEGNTHDMRKAMFARQTMTASNILDSTIGNYQKGLSKSDVGKQTIENPLTDLYTPSIYLTSGMEKLIDNNIYDKKSYDAYIDKLIDSTLSQLSVDRYQTPEQYIWDLNKFRTELKDDASFESIDSTKDFKQWFADKAKINTMKVLWDLDLYTKQDKNINADFLKALDKVAQDDSFQQKMEISKNLDTKLKELKGTDYSIYSKKSNQTPLADMLQEDAIDMKYSDTEDPLIELKDNISNGANYANIFMTRGMLGPDSIAPTDSTKLVATEFTTFPKDVQLNKLKKNKLYTPNDVIGTRNGKPYRYYTSFYVNDIQDDGYVININHPITGKKLTGQGFFKGIVGKSKHLDNPDIDLIVDVNNATKKFNKYSHGFDFAKAWQDAEAVTYTIDGKDYSGYIIKNVPVNIIGDDTHYTQKLDLSDPNNVRRFEVMSSQGNLGLLGIGMYGSTVLKKDGDNFVLDFSEVTQRLRDNDKPHDVTWGDAGTSIMYLRSVALARALGEKRFLGLVNKYNPNAFESVDDYLSNLRNSRDKINSQAALNDQENMIRALGKKDFKKLYDSSDLTKYLFGRDVHTKLNPGQPTVFDDEYYSDIQSPKSKNSGKYQMTAFAKETPGDYISTSGRDVNDRALIQQSYLHIPFDQFYRGVFGKSLNQNDIIDAVIKGQLGYTRFFKNSAMISNDFTPVELSMGSRLQDVMNKNWASSDKKTAIEGTPDIFMPRDTEIGVFAKGSNTGDIFAEAEDPSRPTFNTAVEEARKAGHILSGYDKWTRLSYMLSNAFDTTKNSLSKLGTMKGINSVEMHKYTPQFINKKYGDDSVLNFITTGVDKNVDLNNIQKELRTGTKGYMLRKDIVDTISKHEFNADEVKQLSKSGLLSESNKASEETRRISKEQKKAYNNLLAAFNSQGSSIINNDVKLTWDVENSTTPWKDSQWSRSGIKVDDENKLAVDIGIKNRYAESQYLQEQYMSQLNTLKTLVAKSNTEAFEDFAKYRWLKAAQDADPEGKDVRANYMKATDDMNTLEANYNFYVKNNPEVVKTYEEFVDNMIDFAKKTSDLRNEPFDSYFIFFAPYVSRNKEVRYDTVLSNIRTMMGLNKYDPTSKRNALQQNMMFNFFEGSERMIKDMAEAYSAENISKALLGEYTGKALIDNKEVFNAAYDLLNNKDVMQDLRVYNKFDSEITNEVLNVISLYTDIDVYRIRKNSKNGSELLKQAYDATLYRAEELKAEYTQLTGMPTSLDEVYRVAKEPGLTNETTRVLADELYNTMWAQIVIGQRVLECSPNAQKNFDSFLRAINSEGKVLVNKYGQRIQRGQYLNPTSTNTMSHLKDNVEIAMNSGSDAQWTQYLLEKAISGELYLADADLADSLEKHAWTTKTSGRVISTLKKISSRSAAFQMALPAKMLGRLIRFTGFDYAMGAIGNYETIPNIGRAAKELSAALQSNGKAITDDLKDYLMREGQPTYGRDAKTKDPINFTEDIGDGVIAKITDMMTRPLDFQNHLGRYAIYLTAKESFDNGNPWYGPLYYNHEAIDNIADSRDKAMYIMDYMLGSPGGFPVLSKKTAGLMMYSTFPMNLTRTMGAYGMSMAKLFQEGVTEENAHQWFNTIIMPSLGTVGIAALSNVMLSAICDMYGVDEEKEEEWKKKGVTLDPLGTLLGGTPSVVYDSINPYYNLKEMFINPFTNEYNNNLPKKAYGWIKANMLSKLNPAIKMPIEIITGQDLWGDTAEGYQTADSLFDKTKKHQYTTLENGMKKVLGYFVGSGVAESLVDERKIAAMEQNDDTPSLSSYLWKGLTKGISSDLGNQKSWKKNTSNYYAFLTDMKTFKKAINNTTEGTGNSSNTFGYNYLDIEDMTDAEKLYYNRHYSDLYGTFDDGDYNRVSSTLKKYINQHKDASTIYAYIVKEYNDNRVSEATMRAALNNNSILRKINQLKTGNNYIEYLSSLTADEKMRLQSAIEYEREYYPILQYLFPDNTSNKKAYIPSYKRTYLGSGYPSSGRPYYPSNRYYPGRYYPTTYRFNKKTGNYKWDWKRVKVNVSPQMAIWNQDKNLTQYQTGLSKANDPQWLRSRDYTSRVYQI